MGKVLSKNYKIMKRSNCTKLSLSLILLTLLSYQEIAAQNLNINNQNGSISSYSLQDVRRLTFENSNLVVLLFNGNSFSFPLATLSNYSYNGSVADLEELLFNANDWQLMVFPNPTVDELTIRFSLIKEEEISYSISDLSGKILLSNILGLQTTGDHSFTISICDLPKGNYILRIDRKENSFSKTINKI
jgi:hypothetical protein